MPDLAPIHHVKIPVSDVRASAEWYQRVLGLKVAIDFTEDGELRGVALEAPDGSTPIALRHDPGRAAALSGFDVVAQASDAEDLLRTASTPGSTIWPPSTRSTAASSQATTVAPSSSASTTPTG